MAGGKIETDPEKLATICDNLKKGAEKLFENGAKAGDMWFFELYHHLTDCANALRKQGGAGQPVDGDITRARSSAGSERRTSNPQVAGSSPAERASGIAGAPA
jgi:hypothetical protein